MTRSPEQKKGASRRGNPPPEKRISRGLLPLSKMAPDVAHNAFRKRGFAESRVLTDWDAIVGPRLAESCAPQKITYSGNLGEGGVLTLRVPGALAPDIQHEEPRIIERINGYFGYRAVERLRLVHAPAPKKEKPAVRRPGIGPIDPEKAPLPVSARVLIDDVRDPGLKGALEKLGQAVVAAKNEKKSSEK